MKTELIQGALSKDAPAMTVDLKARFLYAIGFKRCGDGSLILQSLTQPMATLGILSSLAIIALILFLQLLAIAEFPYYTSASNVEENAYTYTSATNFLKYGFMNSLFLQDFSNSSSAADHPYAYIHMPPGPDIVTAVILKVSGGNFRFMRVTFVLIYLIGIGFYIKFAGLVMRTIDDKGRFVVLLFVPTWTLVQHQERMIYSPFLFLTFAPLVALWAYYETSEKGYLYLCFVGTFISSIYLEYSTLVAVVACWVLLYVTQLIRMDAKHLWMSLGAIGAGIVLHLGQNALFLGPSLWFQELGMTISNRITGYPTAEDIKEFFRASSLVLHGSRSIQLQTVLSQIGANFTFPGGSKSATQIACIGLLLSLRFAHVRYGWFSISFDKKGVGAGRYLVRTVLWVSFTILAPILAFPSFAQEVNLSGAGINSYFLAIGFASLLTFAIKQLERFVRFHFAVVVLNFKNAIVVRLRQRQGNIQVPYGSALTHVVRLILCLAMGIGIGLSMAGIAKHKVEEVRLVLSTYGENTYENLDDLRSFSGELFLTNINTPTVGFFVGEAGYGVCGVHSVTDAGGIERDECKVAFMKRHSFWEQKSPKYFFFFSEPKLFPGFGDCLPNTTLRGQVRGGDGCVSLMEERLEEAFVKVHENDLFQVYDLSQVNSR